MQFRARVCLALGLVAVCGCSRNQTVDCEPTDRYATAQSVAPVQIPDDLSPPDETDALRLPPVASSSGDRASGGCLETPPPFFSTGRPGIDPPPSNNAEAASESEPPANAPPEPGGDRAIDN
jgi:hypothetical protein